MGAAAAVRPIGGAGCRAVGSGRGGGVRVMVRARGPGILIRLAGQCVSAMTRQTSATATIVAVTSLSFPGRW